MHFFLSYRVVRVDKVLKLCGKLPESALKDRSLPHMFSTYISKTAKQNKKKKNEELWRLKQGGKKKNKTLHCCYICKCRKRITKTALKLVMAMVSAFINTQTFSWKEQNRLRKERKINLLLTRYLQISKCNQLSYWVRYIATELVPRKISAHQILSKVNQYRAQQTRKKRKERDKSIYLSFHNLRSLKVRWGIIRYRITASEVIIAQVTAPN